MAITITSQIVVAYSQCPRKAYLLMYSEKHGQLHEYQQILEQNRLAYQSRHLDILKQKPNVYPYNLENLKKGCDILIDPRLTADGLQADCDILTKVGKQTYEPTILIGTRAIDDTDKLHLIFIGHVLTKVQGNPPAIGHIIAADGNQRLRNEICWSVFDC
jgi:hypothetical protein